MKTILVPAGGSDTDEAVFRTALAAARPLVAHLEFLHVRIGPCEAAFYTPHVDFARGPAIEAALTSLQREGSRRSTAAAQHVGDFCKRMKIGMAERPGKRDSVTASWREEENDAIERITLRARHNDLVVVGRAPRANGLPHDFLEQILLACGRPVLIAPESPPRSLTGTVMVCWKETPEAARALTAALPLLKVAKLVVFAAAVEDGAPSLDALRDLAHQMEWHGVRAKAHLIEGGGGTAADRLARAGAELGADMLVMGGYGRSRARELIFGGCTQSFLTRAELPVLLQH